MGKHIVPISTAVTLALIIVTTGVMAVFGYFDYTRQRNQGYTELHSNLTIYTHQLASSLVLPLWSFQDAQTAQILKSMMDHEALAAVVVLDSLSNSTVACFSRNAYWEVVQTDAPDVSADLLSRRADIAYNGKLLGSVELYATPAFLHKELDTTFSTIVRNIALVDTSLVILLWLVLNRTVVRPLKTVEAYAMQVSMHSKDDVPVPADAFLLELENLRSSIGNMVGQLQSRYLELQSSRNRLAVAEARYRSIFENALIGIFQVSPQGSLITANAALAEMLGYESPEALLADAGCFETQFLHPASHQDTIPRLVEPSGEVKRHLTPFRRAGDDRRWASMYAKEVRTKDGALACYEGILEDVTERIRAMEELVLAKDFIQNILDSMPSMVIGIDSRHSITHCNRATETETGLAGRELLGRSLPHALPQVAPFMDAVDRALTGGKPVLMSAQPYGASKRDHYVDVLVYPLVSETIKGAVIRLDDVTDKVHMETLFIQTEKMLSLGGLAAGMAHEINNPLSGILQSVQVIERRLGQDSPVNREAASLSGCSLQNIQGYMERRQIMPLLASVRESGARAAKIVADMLAFSRKSESQFAPCQLQELVEKALELCYSDYDLKKKYDFRKIAIQREYDPDLGPVCCTASQIEQVVMNLLRNAAQAMADSDAPNDQPRIVLRTSKESGNMARLEVEDNGPGVDEAVRARIFEPFFTTKPVGEGTGLGLSVSYFIITNNHKGTITAESSPGRGARFVIRLPLAKGGASRA